MNQKQGQALNNFRRVKKSLNQKKKKRYFIQNQSKVNVTEDNLTCFMRRKAFKLIENISLKLVFK